MTTEKINKIRAEYILDNINNGLSFELQNHLIKLMSF